MGIRVSGLASGFDTESLVKDLTAGYTAKKDKVWKAQKSLEYKQDAWKDMNKEIYGFFSDTLSKAKLSSTYKTTEISMSNSKVASVSSPKSISQQNLEVKQLASPTYLTGKEVENPANVGLHGTIVVSMGGTSKEINISADMSMKDVAQKLSAAGLVANFDSGNNRFFLSSVTSGTGSNFEISGNAGVLSALGLDSGAAKVEGKDAIIELNGAQFTSSTNDFKVNDLNIAAKELGSSTVRMESNNQIFDTVKDFVEKYNSLITALNKAYNNTSGKGYEPLTDDEKYALSDKQVEEWEKKLKESALSKDSTVSSITNLLKNTTMGYKSQDGMVLSSIGIKSLSYFEGNNETRGTYKLDEEKLKNVITEDPDKVINFMQGLTSSVYDALNQKMRSTSMNSAYTIYNDKQMQKDIAAYNKKIKDWEEKITKMEDKYYKQFAAMEKALSSLQSQNSALTGLFG